jgi:hypothetical protein
MVIHIPMFLVWMVIGAITIPLGIWLLWNLIGLIIAFIIFRGF